MAKQIKAKDAKDGRLVDIVDAVMDLRESAAGLASITLCMCNSPQDVTKEAFGLLHDTLLGFADKCDALNEFILDRPFDRVNAPLDNE